MENTQERKIHVSIIMDGNGRWAQRRHRPRIWGHVRGSQTVGQIVEAADQLRINALTLYAFSTENWGRPVQEIQTLFKLLKKYIQIERSRIIKNNIRFKVIGDLESMPTDVVAMIRDLEKTTQHALGLKLNFAFGYGSRSEIVTAVNKHISQNPGMKISTDQLENNLMIPDCGDVDLLIRTGGDQRISNFLLWQSAYAELAFTQTPWPEFSKVEFEQIFNQFKSRERRFGQVASTETLDQASLLAQKNIQEIVKAGK